MISDLDFIGKSQIAFKLIVFFIVINQFSSPLINVPHFDGTEVEVFYLAYYLQPWQWTLESNSSHLAAISLWKDSKIMITTHPRKILDTSWSVAFCEEGRQPVTEPELSSSPLLRCLTWKGLRRVEVTRSLNLKLRVSFF